MQSAFEDGHGTAFPVSQSPSEAQMLSVDATFSWFPWVADGHKHSKVGKPHGLQDTQDRADDETTNPHHQQYATLHSTLLWYAVLLDWSLGPPLSLSLNHGDRRSTTHIHIHIQVQAPDRFRSHRDD